MDRKVCFKCGVERPLTEFYAHPRMKDGTVNKCKECNKKDVRKNYRDNVEHYAEYEVSRRDEPHRVKARQEYALTERGVERGNLAKRSYITRNPVKQKAHKLLTNAVRDGKVGKTPCEVCNSTYKIHGHHDDYAKPLEVRWLCSKHHREWHRLNGPGLNGD